MRRAPEMARDFIDLQQPSEAREGRENIQKRDEAGFIYSYNGSNRAFIG